MAQIPVFQPLAQQPASAGALSTLTLQVSAPVKDGDIVVVNGAGFIAPAAANVVGGIAGIAQNNSSSNYGGAASQAAAITESIFPTQAATGLFPASPKGTVITTLGSPVTVAINLSATTGWVTGGTQQANLTTAVGLAIENGVYVADPTASNKVAVISGKVNGPAALAQFGTGAPTAIGFGVEGDLGARVYITFNAAALAIQQGH